jgi:predicted DsbA family dithiol-disulfide isomerase
MAGLEVFFDYACPYCLRGHEYLTALLPRYPDITVKWRPCEAHPRPERYGRHSDLCARAMFFVLEQGANLAEYHRRMFDAALTVRADIEDIGVILDIADGLTDRNGLREALRGGQYADELASNNLLVWEEYDCPAVPSYRMGGELLKSKPDVGVSKQQLAAFLEKNSKT